MTGCLGSLGMTRCLGSLGITGRKTLVSFWDAIFFFRGELLVSGRVHTGKFIYMEPENHPF